MSRIAAAFTRATTGVIEVRPPARQVEPPPPQPKKERGPAEAPPVSVIATEPQPEAESGHGDVQEPQRSRFAKFNPAYVDKLVVSPSMPQSLREQYRRLGAILHHAQVETSLRTLMVTSALPDEGKTVTATNVALTLSESYQRRVLLVDADLRRPSIGNVFQVAKVFGLNEALSSVPERKVSLTQVSRNLSLLTAGTPHPDPMSLLTSDRMRQLLAQAAASFDWVVIDTPPVGILTDANLLGAMVDAALLVIRAGKTPAQIVQRAVDSIGRNRIIGTVLNRTEDQEKWGGNSTYGSYYYYGASSR